MGSGRLPGSVSHFHDVGHQVAAIQRRQSMLESDASLFAAADAHRAVEAGQVIGKTVLTY